MSIKLKKFKAGDYVEIRSGVHDGQMPLDGRRDGLVVQVTGKRRDEYVVMFHNGSFLKFHKTQLKMLEKLVF